MKRLFTSILFCVLLLETLSAQTRTDSISGNYTRHTWNGVGNTHFDFGDGTYGEVCGYTISTTDETLLLDKNHCAALTVYAQPGYSYESLVYGNPVVYYGIWRMSGDTIVITYTKRNANAAFVYFENGEQPSAVTKMDKFIQRKYLIEYNGALASLEPGNYEKYSFYKEEELVQ